MTVCREDVVYVSGLGHKRYEHLPQIIKDRMAVLSVLNAGDNVPGVGNKSSDKTFRVDLENIYDFYNT